jgi:hypothetical protein
MIALKLQRTRALIDNTLSVSLVTANNVTERVKSGFT